MNTIYWLAVFGAVIGIGNFILSIFFALVLYNYGNPLQRFIVSESGLAILHWRSLIAGLASLIVTTTL